MKEYAENEEKLKDANETVTEEKKKADKGPTFKYDYQFYLSFNKLSCLSKNMNQSVISDLPTWSMSTCDSSPRPRMNLVGELKHGIMGQRFNR